MTVWWIFGLIALLFLSAVASGSEIGLYSINRVKLRYRVEAGDRRYRLLSKLVTPTGPTVVCILIANNLAALALTGHMNTAMSDWSESTQMIMTTVVLTPLLLVFGEFVPKQFFRHHSDRVMPSLAVLLWAWRVICTIPVLIISVLTKPFVRRDLEFILPHASRPALRHFLVGEGGGHTLAPMQQDLVDRVMAMERLTVSYSGVTKSLDGISTLDAAATIGVARRGLGPKFFQRYVVRSHNTGSIIGSISATSLVTADSTKRVSDFYVPLIRLPSTTPLHVALQKMHNESAEIALITRDGSVVGIAFINDMVRVLTNLD